jgi:hypothetical protein
MVRDENDDKLKNDMLTGFNIGINAEIPCGELIFIFNQVYFIQLKVQKATMLYLVNPLIQL